MSSIKPDDVYCCEEYVSYLFTDDNMQYYQLPPESYCRGRVIEHELNKYFLIECLSEDKNQILNESLLIPFENAEDLDYIKDVLAINLAYALQFGNAKITTTNPTKNFVGRDSFYITNLSNIEIIIDSKKRKLLSIEEIKKKLASSTIDYSNLPLEASKRLFNTINGHLTISDSIEEFVYNYQCHCGWINSLMNNSFEISKIGSNDKDFLPVIDDNWIKTFISFLNSFETAKDDITVWRRIGEYDLDSNSFISTSICKKFSNCWNFGLEDENKLIKIFIPKGSHYFPIISLTNQKFLNEGEFILLPSKFEYDSEKNHYIYREKNKNEILNNLLYQLKLIRDDYLELTKERIPDYDSAIEDLGNSIKKI